MTSPQIGLLPTCGDDARTMLSTLALVACGESQLGEVVRAEAGQRMTLEPGPQVLDWDQIGCVRGQEGDLQMGAIA